MSAYQFAAFTLELETPLHLGSGRAGMVAKSHAFVPGHLIGYAIATALGRDQGGQPGHFQQALAQVAAAARFAPAFVLGRDGQIITDWAENIERYLSGSAHVALHLASRSAVDGALFELEYLAPRHLRKPRHLCDPDKGQPLRLGGGLWRREDKLGGKTWREWLQLARLGGELKAGYGVVRCVDWQKNPASFHGWAKTDGSGLRLSPGERLWGAALDSVPGLANTPLRPWTGRRHDFSRGAAGFGQRLEQAELVRLHGRYNSDDSLTVLPSPVEGSRWGCWEPADA